jgi:ABC-type uncharacterized transport system substrate-binding protein
MSRLSSLLAVVLLSAAASPAAAQTGKKVLFVNSYHEGYAWSDAEEGGAAAVLGPAGVEMKRLRMDTKRHADEKSIKEAGANVVATIASYKPDVVIVSDDIATKVMVANYKDVAMPWVFCGVNWDASHYGLPFKNATGMVEVALVEKLLETLKVYGKGTRVGFLTVDSETERTEQQAYAKQLKITFAQQKLVKTMAEWKAAFAKMQGEVDVLLLGNFAGIPDWNEAEASAFAVENSKIPSGAMYDFMMPFAMVGMTKIGEEQGTWAGKTALAILKGKAPSSIPVAANKEAKLFLNVKIASRAGIVFKPELVAAAQVIK